MKLGLARIAEMAGAARPAVDSEVTGYSIDSRTARDGDLFFAILGPNFDGHDYVVPALERGSRAAVVTQEWASKHPAIEPVLAVEDPRRALGRLASQARRQWGRPIVAVTGSNGKTTTKELIAVMLATRYRVSKSGGNLNNDLGLPLSLLRFDDQAEIGVLEMGMNHSGEIQALAKVAEPSVGVVTNVTPAHLEHFSSVDEIALAKRELIEGLPGDGVAVLNADDARVRRFAECHGGRNVMFGIDHEADFQAVDVETLGARGVRFRLAGNSSAEGLPIRFSSPLVGRHNISNILAALATASVFDIAPEGLVDAISEFRPRGMRGETLEMGGVLFLNDCYNSNPRAVLEMLEVLRQTPAKRRIAVLGEMRELGRDSADLHRAIGRDVAGGGIGALVAVSGAANETAEEAVRSGLPRSAVHFFETAGEAGDFLTTLLTAGDAVLFKGSRGVGLEIALDAVLASVNVSDNKTKN